MKDFEDDKVSSVFETKQHGDGTDLDFSLSDGSAVPNKSGVQHLETGKRRSSFSRVRVSLLKSGNDGNVDCPDRMLRHLGDTIDQMEVDGKCERACTAPCLAVNPVNTQMHEVISHFKENIDKLLVEETEWKRCIEQFQTQEDDADKSLSQLDMLYSDIPLDVRKLSSTFLPPSSSLADLGSLCTAAVKDVHNIHIMMDKYKHLVELLSWGNRTASMHMDSLIPHFQRQADSLPLDAIFRKYSAQQNY